MRRASERLAACMVSSVVAMGCISEVKEDGTVPERAAEEELALEPVEGVDYTLEANEILVFDMNRAFEVEEIDLDAGVFQVRVESKLVLIGKKPGVHEVKVLGEDGGVLETLRVRVTPDVEGPTKTLRFTKGGLGQPLQFSMHGVSDVIVVDPAALRLEATEGGRRLRMWPTEPRGSSVLVVGGRGIKHMLVGSLPEGELPEGADVYDMEVGGEAHKLDAKGVVDIDVFRPDVVGLTTLDGDLVVVEPLEGGVTPVTFYRGSGKPRTIWYRVTR